MANEKTYCVIYRVGDRERFEWKRSHAMAHEEVRKAVQEIRRSDHHALVEDYNASLAMGLPQTFDTSY